jgi:hypothetical protein
MKSPSRSLLCEWIKSASNSISEETTRRPFLCCGITTNIDGSDDHEIHCFKAGEPCAAGKSVLQEEMKELLVDVANNSDPFADEVAEDEMEDNEAFIDDDSDDSDNDGTDFN